MMRVPRVDPSGPQPEFYLATFRIRTKQLGRLQRRGSHNGLLLPFSKSLKKIVSVLGSSWHFHHRSMTVLVQGQSLKNIWGTGCVRIGRNRRASF